MRRVDIADQTGAGRAAPCDAGGQLEHLEQVIRDKLGELLRIGVLGGAQWGGGDDEMWDRRCIVRREDTVGEADIGEVAAGRRDAGSARSQGASPGRRPSSVTWWPAARAASTMKRPT